MKKSNMETTYSKTPEGNLEETITIVHTPEKLKEWKDQIASLEQEKIDLQARWDTEQAAKLAELAEYFAEKMARIDASIAKIRPKVEKAVEKGVVLETPANVVGE